MEETVAQLITKSRARRWLPDPKQRQHLRVAALLAQSEIGEALGVSRSAISRWESGTRNPRGTVLDHYCRLLLSLAAEVGDPTQSPASDKEEP